MCTYDTKVAEYNAKLLYAQDQYFIARPQLVRTIEREKIFEAGFRLNYYEKESLQNTLNLISDVLDGKGST